MAVVIAGNAMFTAQITVISQVKAVTIPAIVVASFGCA
jgi:hypothetical protein